MSANRAVRRTALSCAAIREKTAILPDYGFRKTETAAAWPAVEAGTSVSGIVGGAITLAVAGLIGFALRKRPGAR